jgi:ABC-type nitrate/sulfonate/bicarbonate transport system ATPase subunit
MQDGPPALELEVVTATWMDGTYRLPVLDGVSLHVHSGEVVAIIGPSGSGKSTLLDVISGLIEPDSGLVRMNGTTTTARERLGKTGYLRQRDLLMPWRSVLQNAAVGLEARGVASRVARSAALKCLDELGLSEYAPAWPSQLSGGMRQRIAIARTLLLESGLLLLDEPFGALDAITRTEMHRWLQATVPVQTTAMILVTHDVEEALTLADRVLVVSPRPASIIAEEPVPFARPRTRSLALAPEFLAAKARLLIHLQTAGKS